MATKNIRIPAELYEAAEKEGAKMHMPASVAIRYFLQLGIDNGHEKVAKKPEKPEIDTEKVLEGLENAAAAGVAALADYLAGLTVHEEQAIKYHIKPAKKAAQAADDDAMLEKMPEIRAELDALCMQGQAVLQAFHDKLPRAVQLELKPVWKEWWRDAGYSDYVLKTSGKRPTKRRDSALWARDAGHSEAEEAARWGVGEENNGQVMDSQNPPNTTAGKRLCPKTLKYID